MITYIKNGEVIASGDMDGFVDSYILLNGKAVTDLQEKRILGVTHSKNGDTYLIKKEDLALFGGFENRAPTAEEIMLHLEKEGI